MRQTDNHSSSYYIQLEKQYAGAHVRRIPTTLNPSEEVPITNHESGSLRSNKSISTISEDEKPTPESTAAPPTTDKPTSDSLPTSILQLKSQSPNKLARSLKSQSTILPSPTSTARRVTLVDAGRSYPTVQAEDDDAPGSTRADPDFSSPKFSEVKKIPAFDTQRRALRGWMRDTLAIRTVGHHNETAAFLLLGSIVPKPAE